MCVGHTMHCAKTAGPTVSQFGKQTPVLPSRHGKGHVNQSINRSIDQSEKCSSGLVAQPLQGRLLH